MNPPPAINLRPSPCGLAVVLGALSLVWLWFVLINDLRVEWTVNPQYSHGWAVPFLYAFLLWQRLQRPGVNGRRLDDL